MCNAVCLVVSSDVATGEAPAANSRRHILMIVRNGKHERCPSCPHVVTIHTLGKSVCRDYITVAHMPQLPTSCLHLSPHNLTPPREPPARVMVWRIPPQHKLRKWAHQELISTSSPRDAAPHTFGDLSLDAGIVNETFAEKTLAAPAHVSI